MVLPLHIFEPRYLQLVDECVTHDEPFGVVLIERGFEVGGGDERFTVGTRARILETADLPDDRKALIAVGTDRFEIDRWLDDDPYPQALVSSRTRSGDASDLPVAELDQRLRRLFAVVSESGIDVGPLDYEISEDPALAIDQLCALSPLGQLDRQRLLESTSPSEQGRLLTGMLEEATSLLQAQLGGA